VAVLASFTFLPQVPQGTTLPLSWSLLPVTLALAAYKFSSNLMFVSIISFFNQVADPAIGGTYMTILNTLANLGHMWISPLALWAIDTVEARRCVGSPEPGVDPRVLSVDRMVEITPPNATSTDCISRAQRTACAAAGGVCVEAVDG